MQRGKSHIRCGGMTLAREVNWGLPDPFLRPLLMMVFLLGLVCGCESHAKSNALANSYYLSPNKDLRRLGRVALVELDNTSSYPPISMEITEALFLETQKEQVFGVMAVRRDDPTWQSLRENLDSLQALRQLATIREALNCSGLLVGTITRYEPYPHLVIGLRLKLLDLTDGQLLWGLEQVWDSADRSIQKRIQAYFRDEQRRSGNTTLREELVIVSSLHFCKFVAYEIAQTFECERRR